VSVHFELSGRGGGGGGGGVGDVGGVDGRFWLLFGGGAWWVDVVRVLAWIFVESPTGMTRPDA